MKNSYKYAKTLFDICLKTDKVTTLKKEFEVLISELKAAEFVFLHNKSPLSIFKA